MNGSPKKKVATKKAAPKKVSTKKIVKSLKMVAPNLILDGGVNPPPPK